MAVAKTDCVCCSTHKTPTAIERKLRAWQWRTGELPQPGLRYSPTPHDAVKGARLWIDADAACGTGKRRDPDDRLALLSLATASGIEIVGISTVFGNAAIAETDPVMRALVHALGSRADRPLPALLPVFKGCGAAATSPDAGRHRRGMQRGEGVVRSPTHRHPASASTAYTRVTLVSINAWCACVVQSIEVRRGCAAFFVSRLWALFDEDQWVR